MWAKATPFGKEDMQHSDGVIFQKVNMCDFEGIQINFCKSTGGRVRIDEEFAKSPNLLKQGGAERF